MISIVRGDSYEVSVANATSSLTAAVVSVAVCPAPIP